MTDAVGAAYARIYDWLERNPAARTLPPHIQAAVDLVRRDQTARGVALDAPAPDRLEADRLAADLEDQLTPYQRRREAEAELADYIEAAGAALGRPEFTDLAGSLRACRQHGHVGLTPDGGLMVAWASKCGQVRLCPDEAREETQRLARHYLDEIHRWVTAKPTRRAFYAVFTTHNHAPGDLARGKRRIFDLVRSRILGRVRSCPVLTGADGPACGLRPETAHADRVFPTIKGALLVQEDPLSARGDWNIHVNAILLTDGRLDFDALRHAWGFNVHIRPIDRDQKSLRGALLEIVKYSARTVAEKSAEHAQAQGEGAAPAMTEWPAELWAEWWDAQRGFRRTRAYGVLHSIHAKRWDAAGLDARARWCEAAGVPRTHAGELWRDLGQPGPQRDREALKARLRAAMSRDGDALDLDRVRWIGVVRYHHGAGYRVDLIQGHNFSGCPGGGGQIYAGEARAGPG